VANAVADIFLVALVFYTLIAIVFGLGNLHNRRDLLRRYENPRRWHVLMLFVIGWAWLVHCCYVVRDYVRECRWERRWRRRTRRPGTVVRRTPEAGGAARGEGGEVVVERVSGGGGEMRGPGVTGNDIERDGDPINVANPGSAGEGAAGQPGEAGNGSKGDENAAAVVNRGGARDTVVGKSGNGVKGDENAAAGQSNS
jgi:hypothetical protein